MSISALNHFFKRSHSTPEDKTMQKARLALTLKTGKLQLWFYHIASRHYFLLSEEGTHEREYNPIEFAQLFDRDDFEVMRSRIFDICEGRRKTAVVSLRSFAEKSEKCNHYRISISIANTDSQGRPTALLGVQHDVTDEFRRQQEADRLLMRYRTVFESSLMDMIYYDKDGVLRDINGRACNTFGVDNRQSVINGNYLLQDNPMFSGLPLDKIEDTRTSSIVDFSHNQNEKNKTDEVHISGKMYYESTINPIRNEKGELEGIYMAGRNISEMVESFHRQQEGTRKLMKATKDIEQYIANINYALRVSDVRLVNYYPKSYTFEISNNVNQGQLHFSQLRCIRLATPRFRRTVNSVLNRMDHFTRHAITQVIETEIRDKKGRQIWLQFNMVPMLDAEGKVERYYGMCRNVTEMVETEQQLAVETKKAKETELLKQAFLTNMSYEIRTPLNNVLGFAEMFNAKHDEAEEPFFAEQIKSNTDILLTLVNDILYLSRLDAHMEEFKKDEVDFALIFDGYCQRGLKDASPDVKINIEHPYNCLVIDIDETHVGNIIQRLCSIASKETQQGTITVRYEYRYGELSIRVEDTGNGIQSDMLPYVFDRFYRNEQGKMCGTGLDLPIVQTLVQNMGGSIDIQSEFGKGTTVWVSIPCTALTQEKKRELDS